MVQVIIDRRRKVATNLDKNVLPIELAARHIFNHGYISDIHHVDDEGEKRKGAGTLIRS